MYHQAVVPVGMGQRLLPQCLVTYLHRRNNLRKFLPLHQCNNRLHLHSKIH